MKNNILNVFGESMFLFSFFFQKLHLGESMFLKLILLVYFYYTVDTKNASGKKTQWQRENNFVAHIIFPLDSAAHDGNDD